MACARQWMNSQTVNIEDASKAAMWDVQRNIAYADAHMSRPTNSQRNDFCLALPTITQQRMFASLCAREKDIVHLLCHRASKEAAESSADPSQMMARVHMSTGHLGCFTAGCAPWLLQAKRAISGRERMAILGISRRDQTCAASDYLLGNLAGNAFSAACVMSFLSAGFSSFQS